jgi:hypothetical protein
MLESGVVESGDSEASVVIERLTTADPDYRMPPPPDEPLSAKSLGVLRNWIDQELPWPDDSSFESSGKYDLPVEPRRPELPTIQDGRDNPVDRIIDAYHSTRNLPRPKPIDDYQFLRRVSLDLIGLPPTPDQLKAFDQDTSSDKRTRFIDELLENREAYAIHWLTFWNDLLRNSYSGTGFIEGGRQQITYWLFRCLLENKPFDRFVSELIDPQPEAAGFIQGFTWRGNVNASQHPAVQFAQNVGQVFLGINLKCASCHDSFIDRWTLNDTYSLAAIYAEQPLQLYRCDKPLGSTAQAAWMFPELGSIDPAAPREARLERLASLMTHPANGQVTRTLVNRLWYQLMGRGIVHPVDAMNSTPWSPDLLDYLASYLQDQHYDTKAVIRLIVSSAAYQSQCELLEEPQSAERFVYAGPLVKRMTVEQFLDSICAITSAWPEPKQEWFVSTDNNQGGQLTAALAALEETGCIANASADKQSSVDTGTEPMPGELARERWSNRPIRAALTPLDLFQAGLGRPNREQVVTSRPSELTTLEAITLANGPHVAQLLKRAASNIASGEQGTNQDLVKWLYLAALSRQPTSTEAALLANALGRRPTLSEVEDVLWNLFMQPEFMLIR